MNEGQITDDSVSCNAGYSNSLFSERYLIRLTVHTINSCFYFGFLSTLKYDVGVLP